MRTGTRCTTLVKLPVAFSGGSRLNCRPRPAPAVDLADDLYARIGIDADRDWLADTRCEIRVS
jgi:hypothetical protein